MCNTRLTKTVLLLTLFLVAWPQISCSSISSEKTTFTINILEYDRVNAHLGKTYEEAWSVINNDLDPKRIFYSIPSSDMETYFWKDQRIIISRDATNRLIQDVSGKAECGLRNGEKEHDNAVVGCSIAQMDGNVFVVVLNGQEVYGGIVNIFGSAERINIPVLYTWLDNGQLVLMIRPEQGVLEDYQEMDPILKSRIEISSVYDYFDGLGKIK